MEQDKRSDLIEKFDTGELSKDIIPPNFTDPDVLFEVLTKLLTAENRQDEMGIIRKAYELAKEAHKDQKRKSGEPYLIHPVCVAIILTQLDMDKETIVGDFFMMSLRTHRILWKTLLRCLVRRLRFWSMVLRN